MSSLRERTRGVGGIRERKGESGRERERGAGFISGAHTEPAALLLKPEVLEEEEGMVER